MSEINYLALRERYSPKPAPRCPVCGEEMSIQRISGAHVVYACSGEGDDGYFKIGRTFADEHYEKSRVTVVDDSDPDVIALLEELDKRRHYIGRLEQENVEMALTLEKLRVEMKAAKSKLNEQREYYEGVISDGSKRIAALLRKDNLVSTTNIEGERR
ncbi:ead/Ea22-like family protein [Escherichia coli]|nr:ead/Ea22-like family protein [Escherichia coli]